MSGNSVVVSRDSRLGPTASNTPNRAATQRRPTRYPITCNRCRKPLATTVFICACDCVFCEECTYIHFEQNSNCPVCNRTLSENDFTEVVVADVSTSTATRTTNFQGYFTKLSVNAPFVAFQDYCARLFKQMDDLRSGSKFVMKQLLADKSREAQRNAQALQVIERQKQEIMSLKQAQNALQLRLDKSAENFQKQLALEKRKNEEKDRQLHQFRQLHQNMTPENPAGYHNNGARRVSGEGMAASSSPRGRQGAPPMGHMPRSPASPPLKAFVIQKEAQQRARQQALEAPQRSRILGMSQQQQQQLHNPYGNRPKSYSGGESYAPTPAHQIIQRPHSTGSGGSGGIRNLTANSGFAFSGGANKRRRGVSPGGQYGQQSTSRYQGSMSPSQAFGMQQPPGGNYSGSRGGGGPSPYLQQNSYNHR